MKANYNDLMSIKQLLSKSNLELQGMLKSLQVLKLMENTIMMILMERGYSGYRDNTLLNGPKYPKAKYDTEDK